MSAHVIQGDALATLRSFPDGIVDSLVTDPPAGIAFMGKQWDADKGGRDAWIAWLAEILRECNRVLKPGGHALVWALPRTSYWTATAIDDAGFEIRDCVVHLFGSGFPKSLNVSKAIDAAKGAKREVVREIVGPVPGDHGGSGAYGHGTDRSITAPATPESTPESAQWSGWGTALKPASEHWWLARKPLEGTVASNVLAHGVGGINIDGCRVEHSSPEDLAKHVAMVEAIKSKGGSMEGSWANASDLAGASDVNTKGRWPANVVLSHSEGCVEVGTREVRANGAILADSKGAVNGLSGYGGDARPRGEWKPYGANGTETIPAWQCAPGCPIAGIDAQSGERPGMSGGGKHRPDATPGMFGAIDCTHTARGDSGGASRFFYCPKPSVREREEGCAALPQKNAAELTGRAEGSAGLAHGRAAGAVHTKGRGNHHPTVKSIALMRYLVRLITPPSGLVLDPFCGSGTTGCAAVLEGMSFVGIEQDAAYAAIAEARINHWGARGART